MPATRRLRPAAPAQICVAHSWPCSCPFLPLQEEALLGCLLAVAISLLLLSLRPDNATDYVYAALFLTCTTSVLKLRWCMGTLALVAPVLVAVATNLRVSLTAAAGLDSACSAAGNGAGAALASCLAANASSSGSSYGPAGQMVLSGRVFEFATVGPLPLEALVHILVAWAVGALMAFVSGESTPGGESGGGGWVASQAGWLARHAGKQLFWAPM